MSEEVQKTPLRPEDNDLQATYRQLQKFVRSVRRDQGRVNTLRLWSPSVAHDGTVVKDIAQVERTDHPSIQLLIERRDRYNDLKRRVEELRDILDNADLPAEARLQGYETYTQLTTRQEKELYAMENALLDLRREFATSAKTMATILVEAAKLSFHRQAHRDKMDLAKGQDPAALSNAELLRIAESEAL